MQRNSPARVTRLDTFDCFPSIGEDNYLVRMIALFSPDVTGTHSFWLRGDDWAILLIGDDHTVESRTVVAELKYSEGSFIT